jgi:Tfp pilus assembly protein PilO
MGLESQINKNKNKVFNIVLIVIALIVASNIYKKQVADINTLKANIEEEEKRNKTLVNIGKLDTKIESYRVLLPKKETSSYMNDINNIARDAGIKIMSIKPSGEETSPDYTKYLYDLTVSSSDYDSLARFINTLEVNKTVYMVDLLDIRSSSYNKEKELSANLRVSAVAMLE